MPSRQLVFSLFSLLTFFSAAFSQTETAENFVIKPGQKVFILAVKGECGNTISPALVNGRVLVIPGEKTQAGSQRKILSYAQPFPPGVEVISQAIAKNKTFVIVNSPSEADFIFHICVAYTEDLMIPEAMQRMRVRSELVFAEARVVPAALYLADNELIFSPMWKANTPDANRPVPTGNSKDDKKKKEKASAPPQQGRVVINGVQMNIAAATASIPPDLEDLVKYFLKDYSKLTAVKIPKGQTEATILEDSPRPALTNKPDDTPNEKSRPTLVNKAGESLSTIKSEASAKPNSEAEEVLKIDTALIFVPVRVLDKAGKYVPDLTKKDFKVFEDSTEQEIENFSNVDDPFHVVLLLDMSGSTRFKVEDIQDAALEFIEQLRPQDRVMIASFESSIFVDADFTNDRAKLTKAILRTRTGGSTRLYDAVDLVLSERLNRIQGRKAIVLFSDGVDSSSRIASVQSNLSKIEESNALVYPIHYDTMSGSTNLSQINGSPIQMPPEMVERLKAQNKERYDRATMYMNELAIRSGGRSYEADTLTDAKVAFANIAEELRRQYWLSYYSTNPKDDGSYRKIRVAVTQSANAPTWAIRAKNGYRAPKK